MLDAVSSATGLPRKQVSRVLGALAASCHRHGEARRLHAARARKMKVRRGVTKARKGINPFTKEPTIFKAKPARKLVKIRPLRHSKTL